MQYGYFDDETRDYVITTPDTPWPWINYLGTRDFFSIISNTGGGYSFYKDALLRRITRYRYNNVPLDSGGRYFYLKERDIIWNPGWRPVNTALDSYECRHGLGYTQIAGVKNGLRASVLFFVPCDFAGEVHYLRLSNESADEKHFTLFSFLEWCLWNAHDDMTNFQRNFSIGEVEIDASTIYHKTEYRERRNHYAFYHVNQPVDGFDTDRESFLGRYHGFHEPRAVLEDAARNSIADGWSPIASQMFRVRLAPGASRDFIFILGYAENSPQNKWEAPGVINKAPARAMIERFASVDQVTQSLAHLRAYWDEQLGTFRLDHSDRRLQRMVNIWNPYQCAVTSRLARSASFFESGIGRGFGFRDANQDLLGVISQRPLFARERIVDLAATQFSDGRCYHQYQPMTKKGNHLVGDNFSDDPLWLIASTAAYIKETSDWDILNVRIPFADDETATASLFDHLRCSFLRVAERCGSHGLALIGRADWNDCLNLNCYSENPDESFQTCTNRDGDVAESIFTAGLFVLYGRDYAWIAETTGEVEEARRASKAVLAMERAILAYGWDGNWYLRAFDSNGEKIGSHSSAEGKIFIESQGICAMAGVGQEQGYPQQALDAVHEHLATDHGIVLNHPAFTQYYLNLGEISSYPAGYKENGGIFCHNNPWVMIGETTIGRGDQAFDYYRRICPAYRENVIEQHKTEPYVYSQMIAGAAANRHGEAKNSWLTGTAAWNYVAITQYILGIRPDYDGLRIDPCIPSCWETYTVHRRFRGADYTITIKNPQGRSRGIWTLIVDGKPIKGNLVPVFSDGKEHVVEAEL